jgi:DNA ligase-1
MKHFAALFTALDQTNSTLKKVNALTDYFDKASDEDKLWTIALFSHKRPRRTVKTTLLREWAAEIGGIPTWLFEESYHTVGDLAESIALIVPSGDLDHEKSLTTWIQEIQALANVDEETKKVMITNAWQSLGPSERFVFNKLITGGFRMGVSQKLMTRALAAHTQIDENELAHRLMGNWSPNNTTYQELIFAQNKAANLSKPYPFYLAYALENDINELGVESDWIAEKKWDGIRGQVVIRGEEVFVWSRGEELVTNRFPEFESFKDVLPDGTVLDGEIIPMKDGIPLSFSELQKRIGRKTVGKKLLKEIPIHLIAYDLLEFEGEDLRSRSLAERRALLETVQSNYKHDRFLLSEKIEFSTWETLVEVRSRAREFHCEGLMLKRSNSPYQVGRKKGDWWKWKVDPLVIDAVMIYAQKGHGRRANMYTDFTFAVWQDEQLIPFTKAYSGLTDSEMREVDKFVKQNTLERFGPVRSVRAELVFEIAFEGINASSRHKSGVALRFPRIKRWRKDKKKEEANTLADLNQMLVQFG